MYESEILSSRSGENVDSDHLVCDAVVSRSWSPVFGRKLEPPTPLPPPLKMETITFF